MDLDDELCLCFHVTQRKVINYIRIEKPRRVAQLSDCQGAGTGCGWCRPYLRKLFDELSEKPETRNPIVALPDAADYAEQRATYRAQSDRGDPS